MPPNGVINGGLIVDAIRDETLDGDFCMTPRWSALRFGRAHDIDWHHSGFFAKGFETGKVWNEAFYEERDEWVRPR
jgi:hypothetical protein